MVTTIGEALMAAFTSDEDAVRAAVAMQRGFPHFIRQYPYAQDVDLKLGIYSGPCFAVTANGLLDYFGQTVNIAARLQGRPRQGIFSFPRSWWRSRPSMGGSRHPHHRAIRRDPERCLPNDARGPCSHAA